MSHNLYGSSLLLVFDTEREQVAMKIIDLRTFVSRGARLSNHRVDHVDLPIAADSEVDSPVRSRLLLAA